MSQYNFKRITVLPSAKEFIDIVLSKTQRKTPTVVHKHYKIIRIRQFYLRKVKFAQQSFHEKLTTILTEFPKLEEVHPFYSDLMSVLYNRDHYKLALGQLNTARHLIDNLAKDYTKMLKYADSLFQCKQQKRAALGRMCTVILRQKANLEYLEEVRQHLSRIPSIDPHTRTIIVCGFPNVGKSSFINKITRADVEVQPYAFTTKSLYVGHTDYKYLRWQVLDTPGLLDAPMEDRNAIEMQAITALAHLRAVVLYVMDLSEQCGHNLAQQVHLFEEIKPLFTNKPTIVCANKIDVVRLEDLDPEKAALLDGLKNDGVPVFSMSTLTEQGLMDVKREACELLLQKRLEQKSRAKNVKEILERVHIAIPKPRDDVERKVTIPPQILLRRIAHEQIRAQQLAHARELDRLEGVEDPETAHKTIVEAMPGEKKTLERDIEVEMEDEYYLDLKKKYLLKYADEIYDVVPETWEGHNIADFIDPEIEQKLLLLEKEEETRERAGYYDSDVESLNEEEMELKGLADKIRQVRAERTLEHRQKIRTPSSRISRVTNPISVATIKSAMIRKKTCLDSDDEPEFVRAARERSRSRLTRKRKRDASASIARSASAVRAPSKLRQAVTDDKMEAKVRKIAHKAQRPLNLQGKRGEADRAIPVKRPKHLFSGKRKSGKTDRR